MLADGIRPQLIVILSDVNIPGMDGLSHRKSLRSRDSLRSPARSAPSVNGRAHWPNSLNDL
jgi:CheY-like chemotaxis protein